MIVPVLMVGFVFVLMFVPCSTGVRVHTRVRALTRVCVRSRARVLAVFAFFSCTVTLCLHVLVFETSTDFIDRNNANLNLHGVIHPFRFSALCGQNRERLLV